MKYGFVTNCLGATTIDEAVRIAEKIGFDYIEVGPSVRRDERAFRALQRNSGVRIRSMIYGRNFLTHEREKREEYVTELRRIIDLAEACDIPQITMSTGGDPTLDLSKNITAMLSFWREIFDKTAEAGIQLALEFCPVAGNFALGPYAWRELFAATKEWPHFGLNYDPSHLLWQSIDPYTPIGEFAARIFSVHAKDTIVRRDVLSEHGFLVPYRRVEMTTHGVEEPRSPWWSYAIPGEGDLDWKRLYHALYTIQYDGAVMIEHEAEPYLGSRERVVEGLRKGLSFLRSVE